MQSQINSERDPARKKVLFQMAMKHQVKLGECACSIYCNFLQYEQHQQMGMRMMGVFSVILWQVGQIVLKQVCNRRECKCPSLEG
jgi:hypothetical protein